MTVSPLVIDGNPSRSVRVERARRVYRELASGVKRVIRGKDVRRVIFSKHSENAESNRQAICELCLDLRFRTAKD